MSLSTVITHKSLEGRTAVITGASSGIGEATAQRLAELGASVALLARRADKLNGLVETITAEGGHAIALPVDVTDREAVMGAATTVSDQLGTADLLVNNAGVQLISPLEESRMEEWQQQIDLNVSGVMNVLGTFLPQLITAADAGKPADIVLTSSIAAKRILEKFSVYSGTKAYLTHFARLARLELGRKMVRVSAIEPGMVDTELPDHVTDHDASTMMADLLREIDVLSPADIAETIAYVASAPRHVNLSELTILPTAQAV